MQRDKKAYAKLWNKFAFCFYFSFAIFLVFWYFKNSNTLESEPFTEPDTPSILRPAAKHIAKPISKAISKDDCKIDMKDLDGFVSSTGVLRDKHNRYTLPGKWKASTKYIKKQFTDRRACGISKDITRYIPFDTHGCCTDKKVKNRPDFTKVFVPDVYQSVSDMPTPSATMKDFLETARNQHIIFLGDSLTLNVWGGFVMHLKATNIKFVEHQEQSEINQGKSLFLTVSVPEYNVDISVLYYYQVDFDMKCQDIEQEAKTITKERLDEIISKATVVIANYGLHFWWDPKVEQRMQLEIIAESVASEREKRGSTDSLCLLWRSIMPQHFKTYYSTGRYGERAAGYAKKEALGCFPLKQHWSHTSILENQEVIAETAVDGKNDPLLYFDSFLEDAHDFHSVKLVDCSHYCYSPLIFNPMFVIITEAMKQNCKVG